jgi:hypothetical protein
MNQLETYHKLRDMQRKIKHLRDLNTMGSTEDPVSRGVALAYDNACGMVDKIANQLYREGITQEETDDQ